MKPTYEELQDLKELERSENVFDKLLRKYKESIKDLKEKLEISLKVYDKLLQKYNNLSMRSKELKRQLRLKTEDIDILKGSNQEIEKQLNEKGKEMINEIEEAMGLEDCDKYCKHLPDKINKLKEKKYMTNTKHTVKNIQ